MPKREITLLTEIRDLLRMITDLDAHKCYRCGRFTMSPAAWCPSCLAAGELLRAAEIQSKPRVKPPRILSPRRSLQ